MKFPEMGALDKVLLPLQRGTVHLAGAHVKNTRFSVYKLA